MIKNYRVALLGAAIVALAGCTGTTGIPGVTVPSTTPSGGTGGAVSSGGAACTTNTSGTAAGGTAVGTSELGDYNGKTLPNGWDTAYHTEQDVTDRISKFADAAKAGGASSADATTWTNFKCIYQPAVAIWRTKTGRSD